MEYRWNIHPSPPQAKVNVLQKALKVNPYICQLLVQRGITTYDEAKHYFRPQLEDLYDPFLMKNMAEAVECLTHTISEGEKIMIYGDYDVDGTTSVSLVYGFLSTFHAEHLVQYIPDRYKEGYGVSDLGVQAAIDQQVGLVITLDCGIKAVNQMQKLHDAGIKTIICDHHLPGDILPNAIVLDPKQHDCNYPFKELCGVGVGFKLMQGFCIQNNIDLTQLYPFLDLVAIGTCADIVPIIDENRILTHYGLQQINKNPRAGIKALIDVAGFEDQLNVTNVVFTIGPRINAAGRIDHALGAVDLLLEKNLNESKEKALLIDSFNKERRTFDAEITKEALQMIASDEKTKNAKTTVLYSPNWHKGVIGIVASRCTEHYYRPTIILTKSEGKVSGSARSVLNFDIHEAIESCADLLDQFGGHKYAAGLTMEEKNVPAFKKRFEEVVAKKISTEVLTATIDIEFELPFERINLKFLNLLDQMQPFGPENMTPVFMTHDVEDAGYTKRVGSDGSHLKLDLIQNGFKVGGIAFGMGHHEQRIKTGQPFSLCYTIEKNVFKGITSVQLMVKDIKFQENTI
jgi:single-stranded-DNA-specific exonuclease